MDIIIFLIGLTIGFLLNIIINRISFNISASKCTNISILVVFISGLLFLISYLKFGLNIIFVKSIVLDSILIIVSFVDLKHKIIPNRIVIITLILGVLFSFVGDISFVNALGGMLVGGGILFLLALIPGALGGGDVKFMFALGSFLGLNKTLGAVFFAFIVAAVISLVLLLFRIKGRKDYIPFGPFLAIGSFFSFIFFI